MVEVSTPGDGPPALARIFLTIPGTRLAYDLGNANRIEHPPAHAAACTVIQHSPVTKTVDTVTMTRRDFLALTMAVPLTRFVPLNLVGPAKPLRFAVLTDLHHGLAPDAMMRLQAFVEAVKRRPDVDLVVQMGDFCYSQPESQECIDLFNTLPHPKIHVLGNHDMDKCDKESAVKFFGMPSRHYSRVVGGYRFVVLDLNHFKKGGQLHSYAKGNYFTDNATHNWIDAPQLGWLAKELHSSREPVILLSHQPLGFAEPGRPLPPEQMEVLQVVKSFGPVAISMFGHLHVDRLEHHDGMPFLCVNSASYFWYEAMQPYSKPLFAFMEIGTDGVLKIEGVAGEFVREPPKGSASVIGRSASISDRLIRTR